MCASGSGRATSPSLRQTALEALCLLATLLLLEYLYVASGLSLRFAVVAQFGLYVGTTAALARHAGLVPRSLRTAGLHVTLLLGGVVVAVATAISSSLRGVLLLGIVGWSLWVVQADPDQQPVAWWPYVTAAVGLAVTFGAFSPLHVGSSLVGTPGGHDVMVALEVTSESAQIFGVETPTLEFVRPHFHAEVHLVQSALGLLVYLLGRTDGSPGRHDPSADRSGWNPMN